MDSARRFERRLLAVSIASGILFLAVLGVFAFLIFRSLSSRLTESVLAQSRADAESIARKLSSPGREPQFRVSEKTRETELYLHSVLQERRTVEYITVTDKEGRKLYEGRAEGRRSYFDEATSSRPDLPGGTGRRSTESTRDYDIAVPIENIGFVHVGVSKEAVAARLESLRSDLVSKTAFAGLFALFALAATDVLLWRLLERNRKLEIAQEQSRALSELGTLAAGLAHEIRNPLNAIGLNLQNLQEQYSADHSRFEPAREEVRRLNRLVGDFLLYARPAPLELSAFRLEPFLAEASSLASFESRGTGVEVRKGEIADIEVRWDAGKIRQVLWNLLKNAIEASGQAQPGAAVTIEARTVEPAGVEVSVIDRGTGIAPEELRRIPSLFFTTKKGGSGLGLMVVSRIVRQHGGTMAIDSKPGVGTRVAIRLPVWIEGTPEGEPPDPA